MLIVDIIIIIVFVIFLDISTKKGSLLHVPLLLRDEQRHGQRLRVKKHYVCENKVN